MSETHYIEVPGRCVPCPRPRVSRRGTYYPKRYTDWLESARYEALRAVGRVLWEGPVTLVVSFNGARPNADTTNMLKSVEDALQGIVFVDDKQVTSVTAEKKTGGTAFTQIQVSERWEANQ